MVRTPTPHQTCTCNPGPTDNVQQWLTPCLCRCARGAAALQRNYVTSPITWIVSRTTRTNTFPRQPTHTNTAKRRQRPGRIPTELRHGPDFTLGIVSRTTRVATIPGRKCTGIRRGASTAQYPQYRWTDATRGNTPGKTPCACTTVNAQGVQGGRHEP